MASGNQAHSPYARRISGMGFLDNLWDETVAGLVPDSGLGRLRNLSHPPPFHRDDNVLVTRSITIVRTARSSALLPGTTEPLSSGTPSTDFKKLTWRKPAVEPSQWAEPRSPTVYDWIVISALDR